MIRNNICEQCQHFFVCEKLKTIRRFDSDDKNYMSVDITIDRCLDYMGPPEGAE